MWNRDDSGPTNADRAQLNPTVTRDERSNEMKDTKVATLGASVLIKGAVTGSEDLVLDGRVEGPIELPENTLTVGPNADIRADIVANSVIVFGAITGNVTARDRVHIRCGASVEGNLSCAQLAIQDGALFKGSVAMGRRSQKPGVTKSDQSSWDQTLATGVATERLMASDRSSP